MLSVLRDAHGHIEATLECLLVNELGILDPQGQYAWCEQLEVSPGCDVVKAARYFMDYFSLWMPTAQWCYWVRRNKTGVKIHGPYSRTQVERFLNSLKGGMVNATV